MSGRISTEKIVIKVSDGSEMPCYLAKPAGAGPKPGVVVFQEIYGVNSHIREVADRLAGEGYVAMAPEVFHRTAAPSWEGVYTRPNEGMGHMKALKPAGIQADLQAVQRWFKNNADTANAPLAALGFCLGGRLSFLANAELPLSAAVSFYGGGIAPALLDKVDNQHGPLLFFWGGKDKHIPAEQTRALVDALSSAKRSFVNVEFSDADHGFFCAERASYHAPSAAPAWALTQSFLKTHLKA
jgi:carboxymethylenebutenolidase